MINLAIDVPEVTSYVSRLYIQDDQAEIFTQIWHSVYIKSEGGADEIVALNNLKKLNASPNLKFPHDSRGKKMLERTIELLDGPVFVFAELPATYTGVCGEGDGPDVQSFLSTNTYFDTMEGGKDKLVDIAKRSIGKLDSAVMLIEEILDGPSKIEYSLLFRDFSRRIKESAVLPLFASLKEPTVSHNK